MNYKLFGLFSVLSDAILTWLLSFVFEKGQSFDVVNVCCCLTLLFLIRFLNIGISHQSTASFLTPLS